MAHSKVNKIKIDAAERRIEALNLRKEGLTYNQIAERMGLSRSRARQLVAEEFVRLKAEQNHAAEEALRVSLSRLDDLLQAVWDEALEGVPEAVRTALAVIDRQVRLVGADAPNRHEVKLERLTEQELLAEARKAGIPVDDRAPEAIDTESPG